ncbi:MAG: pyridoxamine 5'-phosphate oxidase family protein [Tahibacter sp.]
MQSQTTVVAGRDSEELAELGKLIKNVRTAMFTTRTSDGRLVSRPLATRDAPFDGTLWFFTALDSNKVVQLNAEPRVNLSYAGPGDGAYVSIDGHAEVVRDRAMLDEFWNEAFDSIYFPAGKDDPNLVLIRVAVETAEAWTSSTTAIGRAFDFIKAKISGEMSDLGEQKHYEVRRA